MKVKRMLWRASSTLSYQLLRMDLICRLFVVLREQGKQTPLQPSSSPHFIRATSQIPPIVYMSPHQQIKPLLSWLNAVWRISRNKQPVEWWSNANPATSFWLATERNLISPLISKMSFWMPVWSVYQRDSQDGYRIWALSNIRWARRRRVPLLAMRWNVLGS